MKQHSIRRYVALLTLTPLLIITVSLESFFLHDSFSNLDSHLMERGQLIARQFASSSEYGVFANNQEFLQNIARGVMQQPDVTGVIILDAASDVLVEAGEYFGAPQNTAIGANTAMIDADQTQAARIGKVMDLVNSQRPVYRSSERLWIYQPIVPALVVLDEPNARHEVKQTGAVIVEMSRERTEHHKSQMLWLTVGSTTLFLMFSFYLISLASRKITDPIRKLSDVVQALGDGSLETRVSVSAPVSELNTLTRGINDMAAKLQHEQTMLQQRTDTLIEAQRIAHLGNWEWDIVNNVMDWSDEMYRIFGLAPQAFKVTYEAFLQAVHPENRQLVNAKVHDALEQRHNYDIGYRIRLPDGSLRHIHAQGEVNFDEGGQPFKMLGTVQDITERIQAEAALQKNEQRLQEIIDVMPAVLFIKDSASKIMLMNRACEEQWGMNFSDLRGTDASQFFPPEQMAIFLEKDREVFANRQMVDFDEHQWNEFLKKDQIVHTYKKPVYDEAGAPLYLIGMSIDITERKQIELSLLESEERFRKAFQYSAIGMALVGLDGRWLKVNHSFCEIVGYSEQELLSKTFQDITHPDDLQTDLDFVAQLLAGKIDHYQMEKRYFHKDGHIVWIRLSVSMIRDAQDNPIHFVSQIDDITKDKQAEEKILKLNEELETKVLERTKQLLDAQEELVRKEKLAVLGQVAGSVGHELRNPLGVMNNAVYFLQTVLSDADETTREYLNIIKDEINASERIVSDLLDSVRTNPPHPETVGFAELIAQTLGKLTIPPSVTVKLDIPATLAPLRVDAMQIHQVLRNLISNGVEAMPEGGTLAISAVENKQAKNITISVKDSGIGMTPDQLGHLFQPLFTTKARGIGLGLVVVKNLTEANGGTVQVESEVGKGTLFTVTLPAADAQTAGDTT